MANLGARDIKLHLYFSSVLERKQKITYQRALHDYIPYRSPPSNHCEFKVSGKKKPFNKPTLFFFLLQPERVVEVPTTVTAGSYKFHNGYPWGFGGISKGSAVYTCMCVRIYI